MTMKWEEEGGGEVDSGGDMWRHGSVMVTNGGIKRKVGKGMSGLGR